MVLPLIGVEKEGYYKYLRIMSLNDKEGEWKTESERFYKHMDSKKIQLIKNISSNILCLLINNFFEQIHIIIDLQNKTILVDMEVRIISEDDLEISDDSTIFTLKKLFNQRFLEYHNLMTKKREKTSIEFKIN